MQKKYCDMYNIIMKQTFLFKRNTPSEVSDTISLWHDVVSWGQTANAVTKFSESLLKNWKIFYDILPYFSLQENNFQQKY